MEIPKIKAELETAAADTYPKRQKFKDEIQMLERTLIIFEEQIISIKNSLAS